MSKLGVKKRKKASKSNPDADKYLQYDLFAGADKAPEPEGGQIAIDLEYPVQEKAINSDADGGSSSNGTARTDTALDVPPVTNQTQVKGKKRIAVNKSVEVLVEKALESQLKSSDLTEEERKILNEYSGYGGYGSTDEYYTPSWLAQAMWNKVAELGYQGGYAVEPSCGKGVFLQSSPTNTIMTGVELDKTSSTVAKLLHPQHEVLNSNFEKAVKSLHNADLVIGNPPFGVRGSSKNDNNSYSSIERAEEFFIESSLGIMKEKALLAFIVPTRIVDNTNLKEWREKIADYAEFLGAVRLPSGEFKESGTTIPVDLVFFKSYSSEFRSLLLNIDNGDKKRLNILNQNFIQGKYFETDGKKNILGSQRRQDFQNRLVVERDDGLTGESLAPLIIESKIRSMINWFSIKSEFGFSERITSSTPYRTISINNNIYNYDDKWIPKLDADGNLNKEEFGFNSADEVKVACEGLLPLLSCSESQIRAIGKVFRSELCDDLIDVVAQSRLIPSKYRQTYFCGSIAGIYLKRLSASLSVKPIEDIQPLVDSIAERVQKIPSLNDLGPSSKKLKGKVQGIWLFNNTIDSPMDIINEHVLKRSSKSVSKSIDYSDIIQVLQVMEDKSRHSLAELRELYKGELSEDDDKALEFLSMNPAVSVRGDKIFRFEVATSGVVSRQLQSIDYYLNKYGDDPKYAARVLSLLEEKRVIDENANWRTAETASFKLTDYFTPPDVVIEYLHSIGYTDFYYYRDAVDEDGWVHEDKNFNGSFSEGGRYGGYHYKNGKKSSKDTERLQRHLERYLNHEPIRVHSYKPLVKEIDQNFMDWFRSHPEFEPTLLNYNLAVNNYIPLTYSNKPLDISGLSGDISPHPFQSSVVRRAAHEGSLLLGMGTGTGKSPTSLFLHLYNLQLGNTKRGMLVVPSNVYSKWYQEAIKMVGLQGMEKIKFIGLDPVLDNEGEMKKIPIIDDDGVSVKRHKASGEEMYEFAVSYDNTPARIAQDLNEIITSDHHLIVITRDRFNEIHLSPEGVISTAEVLINANVATGALKRDSEKHRDAAKVKKAEEKYTSTGTVRKGHIPYWEQLGIDELIVDESHNFINAYESGKYSRRLAYLSNPQVAQRATHLAMICQYQQDRYAGRGIYMLSATPMVNGPLDIFTHLSFIGGIDAFVKMGIGNSDQFIERFGRTETVPYFKLSGEVVEREALMGWQNLADLRNVFNRYTAFIPAQSVGRDVKIPTVKELNNWVEMTDEMMNVYEELRDRADIINNDVADDDVDREMYRKSLAQKYPGDTVFGLMRKMQKASLDIDFYKQKIVFLIDSITPEQLAVLQQSIPKTIKREFLELNKDDELIAVMRPIPVEMEIESYKEAGKSVSVPIECEKKIVDALKKLKISAYSHPLTPKYTETVASVREVLASGGKVHIWLDELALQPKLSRILQYHIGIPSKEIAVINAKAVDTKKGEDDILAGIQRDFNAGKLRVVIMNKKAEVGIDLHIAPKGLKSIHLTLPPHRTGIEQRIGRGARIGSPQDSIDIEYILSAKSFDLPWLEMCRRKGGYFHELISGNDDTLENIEAMSQDDAAILLAKDPDELKKRKALNEKKQKEKTEFARQGKINRELSNYITGKAMYRKKMASLIHTYSTLDNFEKGKRKIIVEIEDKIKELDIEIVEAREKFLSLQEDVNIELSEKEEARLCLNELKQLRLIRFQSINEVEKEINYFSDWDKRFALMESTLDKMLPKDDSRREAFDRPDDYITVRGRIVSTKKMYEIMGSGIDERKELVIPISYNIEKNEIKCRPVKIFGYRNSDQTYNADLLLDEVPGVTSRQMKIITSDDYDYSIFSAIECGLTKEDFLGFIANDIAVVSNDSYLVFSGGNFSYKSLSELKELELVELINTVVWPCGDDQPLEKALLEFMTHRYQSEGVRAEIAKSRNFQDPKEKAIDKRYLSQILGDDYGHRIESNGVQAEESLLNEFSDAAANKTIKSIGFAKSLEEFEEAVISDAIYPSSRTGSKSSAVIKTIIKNHDNTLETVKGYSNVSLCQEVMSLSKNKVIAQCNEQDVLVAYQDKMQILFNDLINNRDSAVRADNIIAFAGCLKSAVSEYTLWKYAEDRIFHGDEREKLTLIVDLYIEGLVGSKVDLILSLGDMGPRSINDFKSTYSNKPLRDLYELPKDKSRLYAYKSEKEKVSARLQKAAAAIEGEFDIKQSR
ncbi:Eco57I restriction-modification methylase domain-containing protein [Photobacterium leiognathi]|uniref:Eco57I restriction-modification methylase domain-containing protein n=1 Tax=Photobacterium leiognathi TaxID=553611 RepID=UPI00298218D3|nr:Eco57I restriction-modification methylase domain-containing protein [Photobacterium leiognathi]